jgi:hypothetical protein
VKKLIFILSIVSALLVLIGCGGGGGGGGSSSTSGGSTTTYVGRIIDVTTGAGITPAATVQLANGSVSTTTQSDGSFTITVPQTTTTLKVVAGTDGVWNFTFLPQIGTADLGDLWVGPEHVTLKGRALDSTNGLAIGGATVTFAGASATTQGDGTFSMDVAYSSTTQAAFWGIAGSISALNYFVQSFNAAPNVAVSGIVNVGDILLTPSSDPNPPAPPYSIKGRVLPLSSAAGTVVTLSQGSTHLRVYNVGSDGVYLFWIGPGSYSITYTNGSLTAPAQSVTAPALGGTVTVPDVTLH